MDVLSPEAIDFLTSLEQRFGPRREELLQARVARQRELDRGVKPGLLSETAAIREKEWKIAPIPHDLKRRWVEITGPTDKKMVINALNSGADTFMADFEDANAPFWNNMLEGQRNLYDAIRRKIDFVTPEGKGYQLNEKTATLMVRPRGWHLVEKHLLIANKPMSASLFDFGLYFFHNAKELVHRKTGPYFYLPKLENHLEARLWNDVFLFAETALNLPLGTIKATVLIETILAVFEMEEILWELKDHSAGLNAGRWDYLFSVIKKFHAQKGVLQADRSELTMKLPLMQAYTNYLVQVCRKRGAQPIGGMSAFIPSRKDPEVNKIAFAKVTEDKEREVSQGFEGTWVAHPDLVALARAPFEKGRGDPQPFRFEDLLNFEVPGGKITEAGIHSNMRIALKYLSAWLSGVGAVAIDNLMEDAATAEISRAQLWQLHLPDFKKVLDSIEIKDWPYANKIGEAKELLLTLVSVQPFPEFLTTLAYEKIP